MSHLIRHYRQSPEIGWSTPTVLKQDQPAVLAHLDETDEWAMVALHNFGSEPTEVTLDLSTLNRAGLNPVTQLVALLTPGRFELDTGVLRITVDGYGYSWLRVVREGDDRIA